MRKRTMTRGLGGVPGLRNTSGVPGAQMSMPNEESPLTRALNQLDRQGMATNDDTYVSLARWCGDEKALSDGWRLHAHIRGRGRDKNTFLANLLMQMYGKCGSVEDAQNVFDKIAQRNMFSWNFMIAIYAQNGHAAEALQLYRQMHVKGVKPNKFTFFPILTAVANLRALTEGKQVHECIIASGYETDLAMSTALMNMYGKCGSLKDARAVFDEMHERNVISWSAMIAAYAQNGHGKEAFQLFTQMILEGVKPNRITFISILDACASLASLEIGRDVHELIIATGLVLDVTLRSALVNMYGKCGSLKDARAVFDEMHEQNVILWTVMIAAYAQNGQGKEALQLFQQMELEGIKPDLITFLSTLDACAGLASLENGRMIHERIIASGFNWDVTVRNSLVNMYGKCGSLEDAWTVFHGMPERDVISWNAMIAACAQNGHSKDALELFNQMDLEGVKLDRITFLSILDACASLGSLENGRTIHQHVVASGLDTDVTVRTALLNMYGKCGSLKDACMVFDKMHERDVISWNALIGVHVQNGDGKEALELFRQMELEGVKPDRITFLNTVDACVTLASLENGRMIHDCILASGLDSDVAVRNALVNMYGKCGSLKDARVVFDETHERTVISWNAMIAAYAQNGNAEEALELFRQMGLEGVKPNRITFISILNACSHAGLLDAGWQYFVSMSGDHGITPLDEHYVCMSDLLGRVGCLEEAEDLILNMPFETSAVAWTTLLGACRIHGDVERGAHSAEHVFELDPDNTSPYVLLSNIYAATGRWDDVAKVRRAMEERGLKETPGCS